MASDSDAGRLDSFHGAQMKMEWNMKWDQVQSEMIQVENSSPIME